MKSLFFRRCFTCLGAIVTLIVAPLAVAQAQPLSNDDQAKISGQSGPVVQSAPSDNLKIVLLGTGVGPPVNLQQFGASTLVEAGSLRLLFDCGRGATLRLTQIGVPLGSISRIFLTHLHSDHVIQLPDLLLTGWVGGGRSIPLEVWGPEGTRDMMDHVQQAFAFDIRMRRDLDERAPGNGIKVMSHDVKQGIVFDQQGVKVTAFLVDHSPVAPAFGYRVDYRGRSAVLSGDTRVSENLIRFAQGVDVLVHEVLDADTVRAWFPTNPKAAEAILAKHTTPEQAGEVFARVKPRLAVYSHAPNAERVIAQTRKTYTGPLQGAEDMLTIEIGEKIDVRRFAQGQDDEARRQVLATDDRRTDALRRGDSAPLHHIYADDYTLVTPATGVVRSKAEQINDLVSGRVRYEKIEVTERTVRIYGDIAIVLAREKYSILQAGEQVGGDIRFTRAYKRFGAEWRVIATHGSFVKQ
jgi:ribonuclease Z